MERRLAAIVAADMVGYSRLMAADEAGTITRHRSYRRELIDPQIASHDGRVVKATGDGFLAEFPSAIGAVACAAQIQGAIAEHETHEPEARRISYRMGINLGDVVIDEGDVFGDGVNLAARLEQMADPGGLCISEVVFQNVKSKLALRFDDLGEKALKNIPEKIRVYRLIPETGTPPMSKAAGAPGPKLPDKPSIAVLPFVNMSSDPEQEFFAGGMTEDLLTALSRVRELFVISRNSSAVYKGRSVRIEDVARELGVKFVLEGSIRIAGGRVRVTAQLIDGLSGNHVWAENFDGTRDDIFGMQDQLTREIVLALEVKLTYGEHARLWEGQTRNLRAWEKMVFARDLFLRFNSIDNRAAQRALKEALAIDPGCASAMVLLGRCYWWDARFNLAIDKDRSLQLAEEQIESALRVNPEIGGAYMLRGGVAFLRDQHEDAVRFCEKAVDLAPSDSWTTAFLGLVCVFSEEEDKAVAALRTAMRLSPHCPTWYVFNFALAKLGKGDFEEALSAAEEYRVREPEDPFSLALIVIINGLRGNNEMALRAGAQLREAFPAFRIAEVVLAFRYKDQSRLDRQVEVLRRAGIPE